MSRPTPFNLVRPDGFNLSELDRLTETVGTVANPVGLGVQVGAGGVSFLESDREWCYGKLLARDDTKVPPWYEWIEVLPDGKGGFYDNYDGPRFAADTYPAFEANGVPTQVPYYCVLYKGNGNWVEFYSDGRPQVVEVTADTPGVDGLYPGRVLFYNPVTGGYTLGPTCRVKDLNAP